MADDSDNIRSTIVTELRDMLDSFNNYVKTYKTVRDKYTDCEQNQIRLRMLRKRNNDGRRYSLPTTSEVAALIVGDFDLGDCERDVVVED